MAEEFFILHFYVKKWSQSNFFKFFFQLFKSTFFLCSFIEFLDEGAKSDVLETVDWILSLQLENGNIPSKVEEEGIDRGENELVHWCHGATGAVHLMIVAYLRTRNEKYLKVSSIFSALINSFKDFL